MSTAAAVAALSFAPACASSLKLAAKSNAMIDSGFVRSGQLPATPGTTLLAAPIAPPAASQPLRRTGTRIPNASAPPSSLFRLIAILRRFPARPA
jgi:hypothetical protein